VKFKKLYSLSKKLYLCKKYNFKKAMEGIDNFQQIAGILQFDSEDEFYFCQIIKRKKENPELGADNIVVKTYYINSVEHLLSVKDEMTHQCDYHNARVYINLNRRSYEKIAFHALKNITDHLLNKEYKSVKRSYDSVCGQFSIENPKKWIVDIDNKDTDMNEICVFLDTLQPIGAKLLAIIPTKNGNHMITTPFDMSVFKQQFPNIDVHKNNPTVLYSPSF